MTVTGTDVPTGSPGIYYAEPDTSTFHSLTRGVVAGDFTDEVFNAPVSGIWDFTWCFGTLAAQTTQQTAIHFNGFGTDAGSDPARFAAKAVQSFDRETCSSWGGTVLSTDDVRWQMTYSGNDYTTDQVTIKGTLITEQNYPHAQLERDALTALGSGYALGSAATLTFGAFGVEIDSSWFSADGTQFYPEYSGIWRIQANVQWTAGTRTALRITVGSYADTDLALGITESGRTVATSGFGVSGSSSTSDCAFVGYIEAGEYAYVGLTGSSISGPAGNAFTATYYGPSSFHAVYRATGVVRIASSDTYAVAWDVANPHSSATGISSSNWQTSNTVFVVPESAVYAFTFNVYVLTSGDARAHVTVNSYASDDYALGFAGSVRNLLWRELGVASVERLTLTCSSYLQAGEEVYFGIYQASLTINAAQTTLSVAKVAPHQSVSPTALPTVSPSGSPSTSPTASPTKSPTPPTEAPTHSPTLSPTVPPTIPTGAYRLFNAGAQQGNFYSAFTFCITASSNLGLTCSEDSLHLGTCGLACSIASSFDSSAPVYSLSGTLIATAMSDFYSGTLVNSLSDAGLSCSKWWSGSTDAGGVRNSFYCLNSFTPWGTTAGNGGLGSCTQTSNMLQDGEAACSTSQTVICACRK